MLFYECESHNVDYDSDSLLKNGSCNFNDEAEMKKVEGLMLSSNKPNLVKNQTQLKRTNSNREL